jgi:hypothetical protein
VHALNDLDGKGIDAVRDQLSTVPTVSKCFANLKSMLAALTYLRPNTKLSAWMVSLEEWFASTVQANVTAYTKCRVDKLEAMATAAAAGDLKDVLADKGYSKHRQEQLLVLANSVHARSLYGLWKSYDFLDDVDSLGFLPAGLGRETCIAKVQELEQSKFVEVKRLVAMCTAVQQLWKPASVGDRPDQCRRCLALLSSKGLPLPKSIEELLSNEAKKSAAPNKNMRIKSNTS